MEKLNWKIIIIIALSAALISILSGLIGGVDISSILLRALVVLLIFSVFTAVVNLVAVTFLKSSVVESQKTASQQAGTDGSNVNIVLTEDDEAVSGLYSGSDDEQIGEDASQLSDNEQIDEQKVVSSKMDQSASMSMNIDSLPDLGSFSTTFASAEDNEDKKNDSDIESGYNNESTSFSSGSKLSAGGLASTIAEQNSPEDLAKAVKTVLKK